ncbi:MAG: class I SAM-dependent methyltransferase [Elusimicrobia bacterium]|nr:class I SAM-dependent methyltransferase [Elusimicrobiota bacterium]
MVMQAMRVRSVLDIGCGSGMFLRVFAEHGVKDIQGVDGDYVPRQHIQIPASRFLVHDLQTPLRLPRRFDLVVSLEVGEHLMDADADGFISTICRHGDIALFSAAIPGQGGTNHVNEQFPDYWAKKFATHGYSGFDLFRRELWGDEEIATWYRQNLLLFANKKGLSKQKRLAALIKRTPPWKSLNIVHPNLYISRVNELRAQEQLVAYLYERLLESA